MAVLSLVGRVLFGGVLAVTGLNHFTSAVALLVVAGTAWPYSGT